MGRVGIQWRNLREINEVHEQHVVLIITFEATMRKEVTALISYFITQIKILPCNECIHSHISGYIKVEQVLKK